MPFAANSQSIWRLFTDAYVYQIILLNMGFSIFFYKVYFCLYVTIW